MSVGTAALVVGGITAASSIAKGVIGSHAANSAGNTINDAARGAGDSIIDLSKTQYDTQEKNLNPYLAAGQQGVQSLSAAFAPGGELTKQFSFDPSKIADNPNYQFVLAQGNKAVQQSAAAQGGLFSGGTLKALDQYSQGLATQTVNDAYSQALNTFQTNHNNLFQGYTALTNTGETATNQLQNAQALRQQGQIAGTNDYITGAEGKAQGTLAAANQWNQALGGVAGAVTGTIAGGNLFPGGGGGYGAASGLTMDQYPLGTMNVGPQQ